MAEKHSQRKPRGSPGSAKQATELEDGQEPTVGYSGAESVQPQVRYMDDPPRILFVRWLWKYSQIILGALTLLVLVIYGAQWWQARETRELENRAYVVVKSVGLRQNGENPNVSDIVITITNTGRTPGINGMTRAQLHPSETPIPEDAGFPPLDSPSSRTVLAPQIDVEMMLGPVLNRQGEQALQRAAQDSAKAPQPAETNTRPESSPTNTPTPIVGDRKGNPKFLYVYGYISYDDVFGKSHQTRFCYFNVPGTTGWNGCPAFNSFN